MRIKWEILLFLITAAWSCTLLAASPKNYVEGELLVKYRPASVLAKASNAIRQKARSLQDFPTFNVERWKLPSGITMKAAITQLKADPAVEIVEPNYRRYPRFTVSGQTANGQESARLSQVHLDTLWNQPVTRQQKVRIAVIDDAFYIDHPDLLPNVAMAYDAINNNNDPSPQVCADSINTNGSNTEDHGTEVLGVVGAVRGNGIGIDGASDNAEIYPVRISCDYTVAAELAAVQWAIQQQVDIISISYGGPMYSELERTAFQEALNKEIMVVVAAGNYDIDNDKVRDYPSGLDLPNIFAIAGTNGVNELASWSQWGQTTVDLAAPGENFGTTYHDSTIDNTSGPYTDGLQGTSFSAPLIAGILASLMARDPVYNSTKSDWGSVFRARAALMQTALPFVNTAKGRLAVDGYADAMAAYNKLTNNSLEPTIVIKSININDSATGNNNGQIDPGETVSLELTLENQGTDAADISGNLSSNSIPGFSQNFTINTTNSTIPGYQSTTQTFGSYTTNFTLNAGNLPVQQGILFSLGLQGTFFQGTRNFSTTRYFRLDYSSLDNGNIISGTLRKNGDTQDEIDAYHIDVPSNVKTLSLKLNPGQANSNYYGVDLLVKKDHFPQFSYEDYPQYATIQDATEADVLVNAESNVSQKVININNPAPGTYYLAAVANPDDLQSNMTYQVEASYTLKSSKRSSFFGAANPYFILILYLSLIPNLISKSDRV